MKLLHKLTWKSLKMNRKRTLITIFGIVLATALITAVSCIAASFRASMIQVVKKTDGNFHYAFLDVPYKEWKNISNNRSIKSYYRIEKIGYANLPGSKNPDKPYLYLLGFDKAAFENAPIERMEGRYPENDREIVISKHIKTNGGVNYHIGDTLTLDISKRCQGEYEYEQSSPFLGSKEERLKKIFTKEYKVVGTIYRPYYEMEPECAPGYTIITCMEKENIAAKADIYALYTKQAMKKQFEVTAGIQGVHEAVVKKYYLFGREGMMLSQSYALDYNRKSNNDLVIMKYDCRRNSSLIGLQTLNFNGDYMDIMYGMAGIATFMIMISSVFCIRNSFEISITERMKQYGMLASVGATSKQIKKNVFYEVFVLAVASIPLGIISGILAAWILMKIMGDLLGNFKQLDDLYFSFSWEFLAVAIILSFITIYFSARKSARRVSRIAPVTAIRGNEDVKLSAKEVKAPKMIKKLFGTSGMVGYKNLRRNRKKYRTTVISIIVSVSTFIAMSAFVKQSFQLAEAEYGQTPYQLKLYTYHLKTDYKKILSIARLEEVNGVTLMRMIHMSLNDGDLKYRDESMKMRFAGINEIETVALGKQEYRIYLKKLGVSYGQVKDKAILVDSYQEDVLGENEKLKMIYDMKEGDIITGTFEGRNPQDRITKSLEIAAVTENEPMGVEDIFHSGYLIVSDEWIDKYSDYINATSNVFIRCDDADALQETLEKDYGIRENLISNLVNEYHRAKSVSIVIAISLYGFIAVISLIGITNIFNTITAGMELRSKEFAMLKSVGMTTQEFHKMIWMENFFYGTKSLTIGILIGVFVSHFLNVEFAKLFSMRYVFPGMAIVISILIVFALLFGIMKYTINRINRQNIIETIRRDNI